MSLASSSDKAFFDETSAFALSVASVAIASSRNQSTIRRSETNALASSFALSAQMERTSRRSSRFAFRSGRMSHRRTKLCRFDDD
jgi:hypothetical protein